MAKDLQALLAKRCRDVLEDTVRKIADVYHEEVTRVQGHPGYHSQPGQFPFRQTGRGEQNIDWGFQGKGYKAAAGIKEDGYHLQELKEHHERQGLVDAFFAHLGEIRQAAKDAVE